MAHVTNWPLELNWPFLRPMFSRRENEKEFWNHLQFCSNCKSGFQSRFDEYELDDKFWMQVQEYLSGAHLSLQRMAQIIKTEARHDLIDRPTQEASQQIWDGREEIDYHLMICSLCSTRYFDIYRRLGQNDPDVIAAHEKWYGLRTKSSDDSGVPNY